MTQRQVRRVLGKVNVAWAPRGKTLQLMKSVGGSLRLDFPSLFGVMLNLKMISYVISISIATLDHYYSAMQVREFCCRLHPIVAGTHSRKSGNNTLSLDIPSSAKPGETEQPEAGSEQRGDGSRYQQVAAYYSSRQRPSMSFMSGQTGTIVRHAVT